VLTLIIFVALAACAALAALYRRARRKGERQLTRAFVQPAGRPIVRRGGIVISYHPEAREAGEAVLRAGGNAFDAFVAAVAAENVLAEGASSLAGPLGVLVYRAEDGLTEYLDADLNDPLESRPRRVWKGRSPGEVILVPGAPAGLEALSTKYGRLPFGEALRPAVELAADGFTVNNMMALCIKERAELLKESGYGRATFFRDGKPLVAGETIRQPEVADFLRTLGREGSAYVYNGDWGDEFLSTVEAHGGTLTARDLREYGAKWCEPWTTTYRGHTLRSSSGRSYGGLWVLLALRTLEHSNLPQTPRYWEDASCLETLIRVMRQTWSEPDIFNPRVMGDPEAVGPLLTAEYARSIWERVRDKAPHNFMGFAGSHSYHLTVRDDAGNIASGTTTIESLPWADGIFVQGVPLSAAGRIPWNTRPGERRLSPFSIHFAFQEGRPRFAVGSFNNSMVETSFQLLVKLIHYGMSAQDAASTPRVGTFPERATAWRLPIRLDQNWLDPRVDGEVVKELKRRGIKVKATGIIDTGLGVAMRVGPGDEVEGALVPVPYLRNPFG
jgi:gamma-glutamyltranspeptidase/glutathione hydrolase